MQQVEKYGNLESPQDTALTLEHLSYYSRSSNFKRPYYILNVLPKVHFSKLLHKSDQRDLLESWSCSESSIVAGQIYLHVFCLFIQYREKTQDLLSQFIPVLMHEIFHYFTM